jgi:transposase
MTRRQEQILLDEAVGLRTERLGALPVINHFAARLDVEGILERFVPTTDRRVRLPYAKGLGVLLRSILVEREPIYRQYETVSTFSQEAFGLDAQLLHHVKDDAIGRALDRLFDADRAALLTEVVVAATTTFEVTLDELHNDSTTVSFCGQYRGASGRSIRGKRAPFITYGFSKDHRPDLKQLLFILTTSNDGGVPVQFRCEAGNENDSRTHEQTWDALCRASGRTDFLYVADSKLCNREAMDYIDSRQGRFVTVMPRSRLEDAEFRKWIQTHEPKWALVWDRKNPRRRHGPRDRWWVFRYPIPSQESWPVVWVYSSLLALRQQQRRRERIARALQKLDDLNDRLGGPRTRRRRRQEVQQQVDDILREQKVSRYLQVKVVRHKDYYYRQASPGRPGPNTQYIRKSKSHWQVQWDIKEDKIAYDRKSDGMYPLLTNDKSLADAQVLEAHKRQPTVEKRFEQTKTVFEIAPVLLKNEGRIEALFFVYFLALMIQALIERQLRRSMEHNAIEHLPLYPEDRVTHRPTAEQVFRLFSLAARHILHLEGEEIRRFEPELTDLQRRVLQLLQVAESAYRSPQRST